MAHRNDFANATTIQEFEDARQVAIEEIANDPANAHIDDDDIDSFSEGQVDFWLQNLGLMEHRDNLRAASLR